MQREVTLHQPHITLRIPTQKKERTRNVIQDDVQYDLFLILKLTHLTTFLENRVTREKTSSVSAVIGDPKHDQREPHCVTITSRQK